MTEITFQALAPGAEQPELRQMSSGPSGLLLGHGPGGPVTMRLFRAQPTRLFLSAPEYLSWLLAFRAMCLGAHLSIIANDHRGWLVLADAVRSCGGTIDLLRDGENLPGQGRLFRPSLILDVDGAMTGQERLGAWQALVSIGNPASSKAISMLRGSQMAMIAPLEGRAAENLRRAYALSHAQVKAVTDLSEAEVILAGVRRLARVQVPPSPTEHRLLFGG